MFLRLDVCRNPHDPVQMRRTSPLLINPEQIVEVGDFFEWEKDSVAYIRTTSQVDPVLIVTATVPEVQEMLRRCGLIFQFRAKEVLDEPSPSGSSDT